MTTTGEKKKSQVLKVHVRSRLRNFTNAHYFFKLCSLLSGLDSLLRPAPELRSFDEGAIRHSNKELLFSEWGLQKRLPGSLLVGSCSLLKPAAFAPLRPSTVYSECLHCDLHNLLYLAQAQATATIYLMSRKHIFFTRLLRQ